ncbi:efflux RND transporter periplasmic adaptor subunit [Xylocopilactobacillus apicola]|uniref:ABC transporter substrate-binding protein n=1 Tax=Xylocopilactobacillus apicola TaxID=2932184 RepID=A0AAU9CYN6_9LACO|nr:HlyD family efflux transporter periplasmic adaptor subunit [Xylocopilactobacillus apicola]BDR59122.1 ABC transporter substrate-binding protein [Xylocopilactobacillus apicola]
MKKHWIVITITSVAIIAVLVGAMTLLQKRRVAAQMPDRETITETLQVKKSEPLSFNGIYKSNNTQSVSFNQALGDSVNLEKQNGEAVTQGDLIATYYSTKDYNTLLDKKKQINQKNADINNLKQDVQGNSTKITNLTNEVNQLTKDLNKMRDDAPNKVYAQFDGVLTVPTGSNDGVKPLAEISSNEASVQIQVSEYDLSHLQKDQAVKLSPVDSGNKIKGTISSIAERPDNNTSKISTYLVSITTEEALKNGNHVQVSIPLNEVKIPLSAVKEEDKKFYIYKANGSKYTKKEIQGTKKDNYFLVTSGLKNDESIVKNYKAAD